MEPNINLEQNSTAPVKKSNGALMGLIIIIIILILGGIYFFKTMQKKSQPQKPPVNNTQVDIKNLNNIEKELNAETGEVGVDVNSIE